MGTLTGLRTAIREHTAESTTTLPDATIDEFVNAAQERLQTAHEWRGQETTADLSYTVNANGIALPADFISEVAVYQKDATQSDPSKALSEIPKASRANWINRVNAPDQSATYPRTPIAEPLYYIWDEKIFVVPNPSAVLTITLDYHQLLAELSGANLTNFFTVNYFRALKWGGLVEAYLYLHEETHAASADAVFEKLLAKAIVNDSTLKMSGQPRHRGT